MGSLSNRHQRALVLRLACSLARAMTRSDGSSPFAPPSSPARRSSLSLGQGACLSLQQHLKKAFSVTGEPGRPH